MIENAPKIHCILTSQTQSVNSLKQEVEKLTKFEIPLDQITLTSFEQYPALSYIKINEELYDIYRHRTEEIIKKGWIWNGTPKQKLVSDKIGYVQILNVPEIQTSLLDKDPKAKIQEPEPKATYPEPEPTYPDPTYPEPKAKMQESKLKSSIELGVEKQKEINKTNDNNNILEKKTNLIQFESMFLPFFDEIRESNELNSDLENQRPLYITQRGSRAKRRLPYTTRFGNRY